MALNIVGYRRRRRAHLVTVADPGAQYEQFAAAVLAGDARRDRDARRFSAPVGRAAEVVLRQFHHRLRSVARWDAQRVLAKGRLICRVLGLYLWDLDNH